LSINNPNIVEINGRKIGQGFPPYIIAELSANHNGDLQRAVNILEMAKRSGADAVKLQTYTQDTITIDCDKPEFKINGGLWNGRTLYDLYSEAHMPWAWHKPLFEKARELEITIFSTPFDRTSVDMLEELGTPAYKIASFEAIDIPLIQYVAKTGKPLIISTGLADENEIQEAVSAARGNGCRQLILLHCVSGYPAPSEDYNLLTLSDIAKKFGTLTGLSDHTVDNVTAITSVALGARVIEKHVTIDRGAGGPDDSFSLEEADLTQLCRDSKIAWSALGQINYQRKKSEKENLVFRRSLYVVKSVDVGTPLTEENVRSIRPGYGMHPKFFYKVLGKHFTQKVEKGTPLSEDLFG
jgi:pseudaminic acid synthase